MWADFKPIFLKYILIFKQSQKNLLTNADKWLILRSKCLVKERKMKCYSSLKSKKVRDLNCKIVRRKGRVYVINKKNPKLKARQG